MKYLLTIILLFSPEFIWAAPGKNSLRVKDELGDDFLQKNIMKGNWEIGGNGSLGYSSFNGFYSSVNITGRHFFYDHISLGLRAGRHYSGNHKTVLMGPSVNWYFLEMNKWAFNLGQDVIYTDNRYSYSSGYSGQTSEWRGTSKLGANYFINSSVSLGLSLEYNYSLGGRSDGAVVDGLTSKVGFNIAF